MIRMLPFVLMLPVSIPVYAQPEPPPVINPADVFASSVEVVETLPVLTYDNAARLLWYFDPVTMAWESFAYPDGWESTDLVFIDNERQAALLRLNPEDNRDFSNMLVLDMATGEFTPHEYVCGGVPKGRGPLWVIYEQPDGENFLCNTATGETSPPLQLEVEGEIQELCPTPDTMLWGVFGGQVEISPDGQWILFKTCPEWSENVEQNLDKKNYVFAYEVATQNVYFLGQLGETGKPAFTSEVVAWVDNTRPIFQVWMGEKGVYYRAVLPTENSIEKLFEEDSFYAWIDLLQPPGKYVLTRTVGGEGDEDDTCTLQVYEYNLATDEQRVLLELSDDHTDDSGTLNLAMLCSPSIALVNESETFVAIIHESGGLLISIYELATKTLVYQLHGGGGSIDASDSSWISDTVFMHDYVPPTITRVLHLEQSEDGVMVDISDQSSFSLLPPYIHYPGNDLVIVEDSDEIPGIFDSQTLTFIPVFESFENEDTYVSLRWRTEDTLKATLYQTESEYSLERNILGSWIIRIP